MSEVASVIADRYRVRGELGRGGMAVVYRVTDSATREELALKQLQLRLGHGSVAEARARFEREFHTLAQLSHPRIIAVHDYGLDQGGPYYTMELLDGGDLLERSPLPWREACALMHDVCSSLALLHSRRLVHCDVSPRNVRCTKNGEAKLIDFGAMVPMSRGAVIVGTPSFVAPEVVFRSDLDGRTDLYSLGATLYYAVTGRVAYPARSFAELVDAWRVKPRPASHFVPGLPPGLDALLLSLLSLEPAERPRSAFEVMQRLAALAGISHSESSDVSQAYLATPLMIGREALLETIQGELLQTKLAQGRTLMLRGPAGSGRSRMLDACVLAAKMLGFTVTRAGADVARDRDFALAEILGDQLLDGLHETALEIARREGVYDTLFEAVREPEPSLEPAARRVRLRALFEPGLERGKVQAALCRVILACAREQPLLIAVDDLARSDEASASLLASLASQADGTQLLLVLTLDSAAPSGTRNADDVIARHGRVLELSPLSSEQTESLLGSIFGDVQHLALVSRVIHGIAAGNPRLAVDLAQHLVDSGRIRYHGGTWTLPSQLDAADLPASADAALRARVAGLSALSRQLLEAQALASHGAFTRDDYALLSSGADGEQLDQALSELVARDFLHGDGSRFSLVHRAWLRSLTAHMSDQDKRQRHAAIAALYAGSVKALGHLFAAGLQERGLEQLFVFVRAQGDDSVRAFTSLDTGVGELARLFQQALGAAEALGRSAREKTELRRWLASCAPTYDNALFWIAAPAWLEQLRHDSGLALWEEHAAITDPTERLTKALQTAVARYQATPEAERVYRPDEAIRYLVTYVVIGIAVGARSLDDALIDTLPPLLEPFVPLSPAVAVIYQNACATREARVYGRPERARELWLEVYDRLGKMAATEMEYLDLIRGAVASGIGFIEAQIGLASADQWAEAMAADEFQAAQALYLRKVVRLQQGDWAGAERFRKQAELCELQARGSSMFVMNVLCELQAHGMAGDLTGVKQAKDRIDQLAAQAPGWIAVQHQAEGMLQSLLGQHAAACAAFQRCLARAAPRPDDPRGSLALWPLVVAGLIAELRELERCDEAERLGQQTLERCRQLQIGVAAHPVQRELAMVEARLGDFSGAAARLEALIEEQCALGVSGLHLGASYEARARVALWARDEDAVAKYSRATARQYRHGGGSPLGARYERLMDEAREVFPRRLAEFAQLDLAAAGRTQAQREFSTTRIVTQVFRQATHADQRAELALSLLCEDHAARAGYLYICKDGGLTLAAARGAPPPEPRLADLAHSHIQRQIDAMDMATQIADGLESTTQPAIADANGMVYDPVLLTCSVDDALCYVGVALLVPAADAQPQSHRELVTAIASQLFEAGDAPGITG